MSLPAFQAIRYVVPLREGGSLPAILEVEDGSFFATKFRGAGQGPRALVAEIIAGLLARRLGLPVPDVALVHLDEGFGRTERDPEIQDILKASDGLNVGLRYLEGALNFDPLADAELVSPDLAAEIVWFDAFLTNLDRTARNPNILVWNRAIHLIDHGTALYMHFDWSSVDEARMRTAFPMVRQHVLLPLADGIAQAEARLKPVLTRDVLADVLAHVPDDLLMAAPEGTTPPFASAEENREAYLRLLTLRLESSEVFLREAEKAQEELRQEKKKPLSYRR